MFRKFLPALLLSLAAPATLAQAQPHSPTDEPVWAFEESDLPLDPAFHVGVLDNGMRYIIRHNASPEAQGQVRLFIDAGSLSETESELGYAHFIEHMAFNGSTNVPEGEMVALLEREGLAFGPDTNASTSFDYTIYQLDLPRNDPDLLETALFLMRETASELTFDGEAVDREKGVVLSEMRVRDTFALRNALDEFDFFYPDAYFSSRFPIGTTETLQAASSDTLRALYRRIYTPENAVLIVIGDFDTDTVEAEVIDRFSGWSPAETAQVPQLGPVDFARHGETDIHIDQGLNEKLTIALSGPSIEIPDSALVRQRNLLRRIGYSIINRRMRRLATSEDPPFRSVTIGTSDVFEVARTTGLEINSGDGEWPQALAAAAAEYRRAFAYGFSAGEVAEQVAIIRTQIENSAAQSGTLYNATHTASAIALVREEQVPTTPETVLERFESFADAITPESVMQALLEEAIPLDNPLIRFEGRNPPAGGEAALRAAWDAAMAAEVTPGEDLTTAEFAYTDFGTPGVVIEDSREERIGIRRIRFANGVRLNLKPTDLKQDRIDFELNLDGGNMLNTRDNPLATAMIGSLPTGGLGAHTLDELLTILAGHSVVFRIEADGETFRSTGVTTRRDFELQMQLLAAILSDSAFRPQAEAQYKRNIVNFFARRFATPASALNNSLGEILSAGDPRFTLQPQSAYEALGFARLQADVGDRLTSGALELGLVGDFDEDEAIALMARTLGALPPREAEFRTYAENRERQFNPDRSPRVIYHDGEANQAILHFTWPTRDESDYRESIALDLLDRVVQVALTDELREHLGQTYSPSVSAAQSRFYENYGSFTIAASVDVNDVDATRAAMIATIEAIRAAPVGDDLLQRARQPLREIYENALSTNEGLMGLVDRAQSEPERIARYFDTLAYLQTLTGADIQAMALRYLDPAERLEVAVLPRPGDPVGDE